MLIEQLLLGLESVAICDELIAKKPTSFTDAYEIAYSRELTQRAAKEVNTSDVAGNEQTCKLGYAPVKTKNNNSQKKTMQCIGCGGNHVRADCKFRNAKCFACGKVGHIAKVCRNKANQVVIEEVVGEEIEQLNRITKAGTPNAIGRKMLDVVIDGKVIPMELDTGAPCSIICKKNLYSIKSKWNLRKSDRKFISYTGHKINCIGRVAVHVTIGKSTRSLNLYVVQDDLDTLCGREWIAHFARDIDFADLFASRESKSCSDDDSHFTLNRVNNIVSNVCALSASEKIKLQEIIDRFGDVFGQTAGKLIGPPA